MGIKEATKRLWHPPHYPYFFFFAYSTYTMLKLKPPCHHLAMPCAQLSDLEINSLPETELPQPFSLYFPVSKHNQAEQNKWEALFKLEK